jgi:hypothetical protein
MGTGSRSARPEVALYPIALVLGVQFSPNQNDCRGENGTRPWERCVFPSSERSGAAPGTSIVSTERVMLLDPGCSARSSFRAQCVEGGGRLEDASPEPCSDPDPPPAPESSRSAPFASGTLPSRIDVRVDTHDVRGELSRAAVLLGLRAHIADLRLCYEQALVSDATVAGTVRLAFIVSPTGSVNTANIGGGRPVGPARRTVHRGSRATLDVFAAGRWRPRRGERGHHVRVERCSTVSPTRWTRECAPKLRER